LRKLFLKNILGTYYI